MTVFFVLATVVVLVTAQWYFSRLRQRQADLARSAVRFIELGPTSRPADDVLFHPGHTWVQVHGDGLASVGVTAFAGNFAGQIDRVELPSEGRRLHHAEPGLSIVSKGGRRLDLAMPLDGRVLAVNPEVARDPTLLQRRPYDLGWILRVKPRRPAIARRKLYPLAAAQAWLDTAKAAVTQRLARVSTVTAYDGGEWVPAFGEWLEDEDWGALRRELFGEPPVRSESR